MTLKNFSCDFFPFASSFSWVLCIGSYRSFSPPDFALSDVDPISFFLVASRTEFFVPRNHELNAIRICVTSCFFRRHSLAAKESFNGPYPETGPPFFAPYSWKVVRYSYSRILFPPIFFFFPAVAPTPELLFAPPPDFLVRST